MDHDSSSYHKKSNVEFNKKYFSYKEILSLPHPLLEQPMQLELWAKVPLSHYYRSRQGMEEEVVEGTTQKSVDKVCQVQ